jgi:hypothetical protein
MMRPVSRHWFPELWFSPSPRLAQPRSTISQPRSGFDLICRWPASRLSPRLAHCQWLRPFPQPAPRSLSTLITSSKLFQGAIIQQHMSPRRLCDCRSLQDCVTCPAAREVCSARWNRTCGIHTAPDQRVLAGDRSCGLCSGGSFDRRRSDTPATIDRLTHWPGCICNGRRSRPAPHLLGRQRLSKTRCKGSAGVENVTSYDTSNVLCS